MEHDLVIRHMAHWKVFLNKVKKKTSYNEMYQ